VRGDGERITGFITSFYGKPIPRRGWPRVWTPD
jgi:hypothetical protein